MSEQLRFGGGDEQLEALRKKCVEESVLHNCPMFIIRFEVIVANKHREGDRVDVRSVMLGSERPLDSAEFKTHLKTLLEPAAAEEEYVPLPPPGQPYTETQMDQAYREAGIRPV